MALLLLALPIMAFAHGISEADKQRMLDGGYLQYVGLGASHMLTGYDHLFDVPPFSVALGFRVQGLI